MQSAYAHESSSRNTKDLRRRTSTHDHHRRLLVQRSFIYLLEILIRRNFGCWWIDLQGAGLWCDIHERLDTKEDENDIYKMAKNRERKTRYPNQVKCIKDEDKTSSKN